MRCHFKSWEKAIIHQIQNSKLTSPVKSLLWCAASHKCTFSHSTKYIIQILTALRGTVKIIGPRWCQNHDYARSEAEGIVMVLTSPRAYNFKLCPSKQSIFVLHKLIYRMKINAKFKSIFHFDTLFTKLKIISVNSAGSLLLSRNYRAIDYAPGHSHFSGHSWNYARSFNQSDDRNLPMRYINIYIPDRTTVLWYNHANTLKSTTIFLNVKNTICRIKT